MPSTTQVSKALFVRLEALPGKEDDLRAFLNSGLSIVEGEPKTVRWFGVQFGPSTFGIFDAFPDEEGRQAHLSGEVADALSQNAGHLFEEPEIEQLDVVAEKPPA
jgi:quinol monooxygenase YgiN